MQGPRALVATLVTLSTLLAGCSSGGSGNGFSVKAPAAAGGAYTFTADAKADNYTWDLGDHLTTLYGKSVTHTYDFKDGTITVTLKTTTGGQSKETSQPLVLGTGQNQKATFLMEAQTDWAVVGQTITFSAARSFDPEHDPLRFSWSCLKTAEAERKPAHTHPVIGQPFASPPAGSVTTGKTNRTLPAPDHTFDGDLCESLGVGTHASTAMTTIAGKFTKTGVYSIYLLAADGPHPTTSGEFKLYVTPPGDRPNPVVNKTLDPLFSGGANGSLQTVCSNPSNPAGPLTCDDVTSTFDLPLGGVSMAVNFTYASQTPGSPDQATALQWVIKRGDATVVSGTANNDHLVVAEPAKLGAGTYTAEIKLNSGANVQAHLAIVVHLDMDPAKVY